MALSAPLAVRDASTSFSSIDDYYSIVPTCGVQCEKDFWGAFINTTQCGGDKTDFKCFCNSDVVSVNQYSDLRTTEAECFMDKCPRSQDGETAIATNKIAMFCASVLHPTAAGSSSSSAGGSTSTTITKTISTATSKSTSTTTSTSTSTSTSTPASTSASASRASFSLSQPSFGLGFLFLSLALFAHT